MLVRDPINVVGMYPGTLGLPERTEKILERADVVVGGKRLLASYALSRCADCNPEQTQIPLGGHLPEVFESIRRHHESGRRVVVLADGDPLFFGLGIRLVQEFGTDNIRIHPNLTTVQTAAARLNTSWHDIAVVSLHGRDDFAPLYSAMMRTERVAVFTDGDNTPQAIAQKLLDKGAEGYFMVVLEDLNTPQERIRRLSLRDVWDRTFSPLNLCILERGYPPEIQPGLGIPDHYYLHERNMITKRAIRAAGLAALMVQPESTVWDLGAGSGSVAIEAASLARFGRVFAVERNRTRAATIRENVRRTGAWLVDVVRGELPHCLHQLPDPDRIFIGGGLGGDANQDSDLLERACERLNAPGRIVVHCILLDTLLKTKEHFQKMGWAFGATQIQASTSETLAGDLRFKADNPVFILWAEKPAPREEL